MFENKIIRIIIEENDGEVLKKRTFEFKNYKGVVVVFVVAIFALILFHKEVALLLKFVGWIQ